MNKKGRIGLFMTIGLIGGSGVQAQLGIVEAVQFLATKVIKAVDLQVQRWQNQTIWLQEAQKTLENTLSELKLKEIAGWVQEQKDLYGNYFDELSHVKSILTGYHRVKEMMSRQTAILTEYKRAMTLFRQDGHFSTQELQHMQAVYEGILAESLQWLDQVGTVLEALVTKMTDEQRLQLMEEGADQVDKHYNDLQAFTNQNKILSLQRSKDQDEINRVRKLYDLP